MNRLVRTGAALIAASLFSLSSSGQTIGCEVGSANGGAIPASGTGDGTFQTALPTAPSVFSLTVTALPVGATCVTEVRLHGLTHTYINDIQLVLTNPTGTRYNVLCRPPGSCDFVGDYTIVQSCTGGLAWPATCTTTIAPGTYDQYFDGWTNGNFSISNTPLNSIAPATGAWTLTAYDWAAIDTGALVSWDLCFGTPVAPSAPTAAPTLATPANGASVFGPNVTLTWSTVDCAASYEVDVDGVVYPTASNSYAYTSAPGSHTWKARGVNASGVGPYSASSMYTDLGPPPSPCSGPALTTLFAQNNGGSVGGQVFFDVNVINAAGIVVAQLDTNTSLTVGTAFSMSIYTKAGTFVGFENNIGAWTLTATGAGIAAGLDQHTLIEFPDFPLAPGVSGFALVMNGAAHSYTGTAAIPPPTFFSNADLSITGGKALNVPWTGAPFSPRMWNGSVRYNCTPPGPVSYCTAGTTTNGCLASISGSANPSVSMANPCNITVSGVEGQKNGIVFYGLASNSIPWATGSNSFLCVKPPTQRTGTQSSGGTMNVCDGTMVLDWNAFQTANPTALGNPWSVGNKAYVQAWFRDPPAIKTTNLSDGLELTYVP